MHRLLVTSLVAVAFCAAFARAEAVLEQLPPEQVAQRRAQAAQLNTVIKQMPIERFEARVHEDSSNKTLPYRLFRPREVDPQQRYPLVIFLHGAGERGTDNVKQLALGGRLGAFLWALPENQAKHPCFILAPQCPDNDRWAQVMWTDDSHALPPRPTESMRLAMDLIDATMRQFPIDPDRVYVTGLSMGGYGTWDLLCRRPDLAAAAVPICGGLADDQAARIAHIPQWIFHGDRDTVVKTIRSRNAFAQLKAAGATSVRYTELENVDHASWDPAYATPELVEWMMSQKRKPRP